ncbi:MAG: helix-turn-helix transcriptional regulator [Candidatus Acidiferrales bacterium]
MAKDVFLDTVAAIYDAALQPEAWPVALSRVGDLIGGSWLLMAAIRPTGVSDFIAQDQHGTAEHLALFQQKYNNPETNPAIPSLMSAGPGGIVFRERDMSDQEWLRSGLYREIYRPNGIYHGIGAFVLKTETHVAFLGANRPKSGGQFTSAAVGLLRQTMPHLGRSLQVHLRLADLQSEKTAHQALWDALAFGVVLLDREGKILWTNREATAILARGDGLRIRNKFLSAACATEHAELQRLIRASVATSEGRAAAPDAALRVSRPSLARALALLIAPIRIQRAFCGQPVAVAFVTDPERQRQPIPDVLKRLYGLTPREAALAALLLQGIDLREAAEQLEVSMNTARTHLRLVFEKTDTHRQSELVHLLLRGPAGLV